MTDAQADLTERARTLVGIWYMDHNGYVDLVARKALGQRIAAALQSERDRCLRIMKSSSVFWTEDKIKYMREGLEPRDALASPPAPQEE